MLIDSHAHLYSERFDRDRDKIIRELKDDGIELVILPGASIESSIEAVSLAAEYDNLYATVGVHPNSLDEMDCDSIKTLRN